MNLYNASMPEKRHTLVIQKERNTKLWWH